MKPARFDYVRAESIAHAVEALAGAGGDGKVLAGGQSLMPMMNFRLVKPSVLVDINRIPDLDRITLEANTLRLGALVRHRMTAEDALVARHIPVLLAAMKHVAHLTVRNRGTFCGSVCHADPAAEMPMMTLLLDGTIHIASPRGTRTMPARDFLIGSLATALEPDEMVTAVDLAIPQDGTGWAFEEFSRRHGDYALAAVAVLMERADGRMRNVRIAMMGIADTALRFSDVEAALEGREGTPASFDEAATLLQASIEPNSDLSASADYRRHLAGALARRALADAWRRARDTAEGAA
ncbi:carbon-monoxide dehydrogenase medium subunit [Xanthobacter flavus]|uniref:Carbon monoxide dehydrogenase n=1 Tax=Xanthobacter flavus TaxID=281 RepID=A0A9W6CIM2_XANFL|nr:xanthine dehydrogenase family protein subunit M [Xanthobacter flavus]MBN8916291.1 xanthine dehydrogenase family protein subunit M [Hyphomicrobiales bacterium]MDR6334363.1 carbon-monoxide dehydrogenase medium subunit [Xanthobacter flavus]GLI23083.1 carbon monoxide dehydrogenase [Xanthobacter flavus]